MHVVNKLYPNDELKRGIFLYVEVEFQSLQCFNFQDCISTILVPQGVLRISSDGYDRMWAKFKTQKTAWTKN